jgi:hypothetical protein
VTETGDGFREIFADRGQITVAGAKAKEFKGHVPEVEPKIFDALSATKRQKLIDEGVVKIVPHWKAILLRETAQNMPTPNSFRDPRLGFVFRHTPGLLRLGAGYVSFRGRRHVTLC